MPVTGNIKTQTDLLTDINAVIKNNAVPLIRGDVLAQRLADIEKSSINNLTDYSNTSSIIFKNNAGVITNLVIGSDSLIGKEGSGNIISITVGSGLTLSGGILEATGGGGIALTDLSAVLPLAYDDTTGVFTTSMATGKLIGRSSGGAGVMEEITIGSGLSLVAGTLAATGGGTIIDVGTTSIINGDIGAIPFHGGSDVYQEEPTLFYWSPSNNFLGVGLDTPSARVHIKGTTSGATSYALKVDNLAGTSFLHIRNDGVWALGINASASIANQASTDVNINGTLGTSGQNRTAVNGNVDGYYSTAVGTSSVAIAAGATSLGAYTYASAAAALAVGMEMQATAVGAVIIGSDYNAAIVNAIPRSFMIGLGGNSGVLHKQSLFVNFKTNIVLRSESDITTGTHYDEYATNTVTVHNGLTATPMTVTSVSSIGGAKAQFNFAANNTILLGDKVITSGFGVYSNGTFYLGSVGGTSVQLYLTRADAVANINSVAFISTDTGTITPQPRNPALNITDSFQLYCVAGQAWILPGSGAAFPIGSGLGGANTALSNLASVAINTDLLLGTSDGGALGSATKMWSDLFLASGAVINFNNGDITIGHASNLLTFSGAASGYSFDTLIRPAANDGTALGTGALSFSDLFLASGAVVNFANSDVLITHSTNLLAFSGATSGYTFDVAIGVASGGTAKSSIAANKMLVALTANTYTETPYFDVAEQALATTPVFIAGTAPSGATTHSYRWHQIGNLCFVRINLVFATAGATVSNCLIPFPADVPAPSVPNGFTGAGSIYYYGAGGSAPLVTSIAGNIAKSYVRRNAANNGFEFGIDMTSTSSKIYYVDIWYPTT